MILGLHFEEHGPAGAPPLILSAGLGGSAAYWQPNLAALAERHRVIAYDQRGTGRSDRRLPAGHDLEAMADDVIALMTGLGLERAGFVGHALGAAIGLTLALRAPERLAWLVAVNGWARLDPHTARCFEIRQDLLRDTGPRAFLRAQPIFLYPATWISEHRNALDVELESQLAQFQGEANFETRLAALQAFHVADRLGEVGTATLAIAAKDDMLVPWTSSADLAEKIPGARVALMDWGGHACNVTDPQGFNQILRDWLAAAPSEGAS